MASRWLQDASIFHTFLVPKIIHLRPRMWISIIDPTPGAKTCALLHLRRNPSRSYSGRWWNRPFPSASALPDTKIMNKTNKTVVPCCSSIPLFLLGRIWSFMRIWLQHVKKSFGGQCQARVPCPWNLRHMFKKNSISNALQGQTSIQPKTWKALVILLYLIQKCACLSVSFHPEEQIYCVHCLHMNLTQPTLSLSTEPYWYDPKTSCLFAPLLPCLPWKQMQSTRYTPFVTPSARDSAPCALFFRLPNVSWISATFPRKSRKAKRSSILLSSVMLYPPDVLASSVLFLQRPHLRLQTLWIDHHCKSGKY